MNWKINLKNSLMELMECLWSAQIDWNFAAHCLPPLYAKTTKTTTTKNLSQMQFRTTQLSVSLWNYVQHQLLKMISINLLLHALVIRWENLFFVSNCYNNKKHLYLGFVTIMQCQCKLYYYYIDNFFNDMCTIVFTFSFISISHATCIKFLLLLANFAVWFSINSWCWWKYFFTLNERNDGRKSWLTTTRF